MDKNVEKLREALCKANRRLKAAGVEYAPKDGDFSSDRSKAVTIVSEAYRNEVESCFGESCDDVLGGYDISDEMMAGKHGKELIDDICDHVGTEYFADKVAKVRHKAKEPVEEGRNNVELNRILPTVAFIDAADADYYGRIHRGYPDTEEFADADGNVDYEAYDDAVDAFVSSKEKELSDLYGLGMVYDREGLDDSLYDFNQETIRQADDLWKMGDEQGHADSEALKGIMLGIEPNYDVGSRVVCENEQDFQILSAPVREAQIKRFSDYLRSLCGKFGLVEWDKSKNNYAYGSPKEAGIPEAKGLSEGYLGQTVEDFFDDCADTFPLDRVIVYANDDEEPVYDGDYQDIPETILEAPFLEFGTDRLTVNVADEGGSAYYDTLDDFLGDGNVELIEVWDTDSEDIAFDGDKDDLDDELGQKSFLSFDAPDYISINLDCDKSDLDLDDLEEAKGRKRKKKGIHVRANAGDPKRNAAFFNMAMGASEYASDGGCCGGESDGGEGGIGESEECGKTIAKVFKGKGRRKVDEVNDDELRRMPSGTEKRCIGMLNSMIAYNWDRKESAREFLDRIEGTHHYDYIKKYVDELGKDKVAELMQRQIDDVDRIVYAGTDSEGLSYNAIIWKDAKRESLKPRRLAFDESEAKANEDTEKLKDGSPEDAKVDGHAEAGYVGNAKIVDDKDKLPKVGEPFGYKGYFVISVTKVRNQDGYDIYEVKTQEKDAIDRGLDDTWDVAKWSFAIKSPITPVNYFEQESVGNNVREANKNISKLASEGIQYFGTKNQFNYDKQQLRIDHDAKTYERGIFTHISRHETVSTPELHRIIKRLDDMGYKEVKHSEPSGETKAPEGYFEAWESHSKAKYFEAWERHSAEKAFDKSHSEGHDILGKKEDTMDNGNKDVKESKSKGGLVKKILDFVDKNVPEAELTDEVIDDWEW